MKKLLIVLSFLLSANFMIAQSISLNLPEIDMTGKVPGDKIDIDIYIDAMTPAAQIWGFQLFFNVPAGSLTWDGTINVPMPGVLYLNPLFGTTIGAFQMNFVNNQMGWLWGDGGSYVILDGQTFPVKIATLRFTYQNPPLLGPLSWQITKGVDNGGWMVKGKSDVYYNDFFESFPEQTYADGSMFIPSGGTPGLWTGAVDSDWFNPGNWDDGNVPPPGINIEIPNVGKAAFPVIIGGPVVVGTLNIAPLASLTLGCASGGPCGELTTLGLFTNNGSFSMDTEALNGYSATFIDQGGLAGAGMFYYTRDMLCTGTMGNSTDPNWHYVAAPIDGFDTWDMFDYYVNAWDQPTGFWNQVEGIAHNYAGPGPQIPLAPMDAWSVNYALDYTCNVQYPGTGLDLEFMGPAPAVHSGPYAKPFGYGATGYQMWNMIGNPYPSGLDMSLISWSPSMVQGAAYWDGCFGGYVYWTPALGTYSMAPGLGFFTEATAPGLFTLTGAERAHGADWFWKSEVTNLVTLQATGNEKSDLTHIRFMENASPAFETTGDFHKLFVDGSPMIYTTAGADMLAVNVLPETPVVPMDFTSTVSGSFTISAIETSDFANVVLEDRTNGVQTDLLTGSYTFNYTVGDNVNRFFVHFTPLGTPELAANSINIWAADHNIYVQAPATTGDIVVYNLMGQEVVRTDIEAGLNVIPMTDVNTYYIVKVIGSDITETGKVFIK